MQSTLYLSQNPFIRQLCLRQAGLATKPPGLMLPWISDCRMLFLTMLKGLCSWRKSWNDCAKELWDNFLPEKFPPESGDCFQSPHGIYGGITFISYSLLNSSSNVFCSKYCDTCCHITGLLKNWIHYSEKIVGPC